VHSVEIRVTPLSAWLEGRVIDDGGEPVYAELVVLHAGLQSRQENKTATTQEDGTWKLNSLDPGPTHIRVFSARRSSSRVDVDLVPGKNPPLEIVLPRSTAGGDLTGTLSASTGAPPRGLVLLQSEDRTSPFRSLQWVGVPGEADASFGFLGLPAGRYTLSCIGLDGREYTPKSTSVSPPQVVQFSTSEIASVAPILDYQLRLLDAASGKVLDDEEMQCMRSCMGLWRQDPFPDRIPLGDVWFYGEQAPVDVVVGLPGFMPACVGFPEALRTAHREAGRVEIELRLHAGYGAALVVLDAEADRRVRLSHHDRRSGGFGSFGFAPTPLSGIPGAKIVSRGRVIGFSDKQGLALCSSDEPIEEFEVALDGWTTLTVEGFNGHAEDPCGLGYILMVRD